MNTILPRIEISQSGRGGSIRYVEGDHVASFSWEFALSPTLALIFGTPARLWDRDHPWAAGRQEAVFYFVARAVIREKASGYEHRMDLERGQIEIVERGATGAADRTSFSRHELTPGGEISIDPREALKHHLSIDVRLSAAEKMVAIDPAFDLEAFLAMQIRNLHSKSDGLTRALRLAAEHPGEEVRQALLYASWNRTECAQDCARLLLDLSSATPQPGDTEAETMIAGLGFHTNYFTRKAAFDELCRRTDMTLMP